MSDRTFKIDDPHVHGDDVKAWQQFLYDDFRDRWSIEYPLDVDGDYGLDTRGATASFLRAWGVVSAAEAMSSGVTPELRSKIRNNDRSDVEKWLSLSDERKEYRAALRDRYGTAAAVVMPVVTDMATNTNGWTGPHGHDGIDLICAASAPLSAMCKSKVVRVAKDGWWGNNPQPSPGHPVSDGDGIIILEVLEDAGPFKKGMHVCYGHAEKAIVAVGEIVKAGQRIGSAGFARAWHVHFMINNIPPNDGFYTGKGDRDPRPYLDYANASD